ncbi:MAG: cyclophilin-like fold protein [Bacilli bacterium]
MKKIVIIIISILVISAIVGGIVFLNSKETEGTNNNTNTSQMYEQDNETISNITNNNEILQSNNSTEQTTSSLQTNEGNSNEYMQNTRIKLTFDNEEVYVKLDNNQSSKDFLEMLPLTLTFEDYNNTEKIANLPEKLSTEGTPSGYDPQIGDFSYYAPWGNLSVFYKDFRYSNSLVKLGTFESGIEKLGNMNEDFTVRIERVD